MSSHSWPAARSFIRQSLRSGSPDVAIENQGFATGRRWSKLLGCFLRGVRGVRGVRLQQYFLQNQVFWNDFFSSSSTPPVLLNNSSEQFFFCISGRRVLVGCQKHTELEPVCSPLFRLFTNIRLLDWFSMLTNESVRFTKLTNVNQWVCQVNQCLKGCPGFPGCPGCPLYQCFPILTNGGARFTNVSPC